MMAEPDWSGFSDEAAFEGENLSVSFAHIACPPSILHGIESDASVALYLADPVKLAWSIAFLGGRVRRLILVSIDTSSEALALICKEAGADLIVADRAVESPGLHERALLWDGPALPGLKASTRAVCDTEWVLATSGTTGVPKLVQHSWTSLTRTVRQANSARQRWGQVYNLCRFAGLQVFVQSFLSNSTLVLPRLDQSLAAQLSFLARRQITALSATPTLWRKILMQPEGQGLPLKQVTLGGEIVDDFILHALSERFPLARVVHIYASTEAGAAFSVSDGKAGFPASFLRERQTTGVKVQVRDGRLLILNTGVRPGYLGQMGRFVDDEGFIDTGDIVEQRGDRFLFLGRSNGMINVGGNKLYPEEVENVLLECPGVRFARVRAQRSPIMGQLVSAEIIPDSATGNTADFIKAVKAHCQEKLQPWKVPALIRIVEALGANAGGKLERKA